MISNSNTNGSLPSVHLTILDNDKEDDIKFHLRINKFLILLCITLMILLLIVYYKWQQIPYRRHFFQVEYLASSDTSAISLRPIIEISDAKILDIDQEFIETNNQYHNRFFHSDYTLDKTYKETVEITELFSNKNNKTKANQIYNIDSLSNFIDPNILLEIKAYCSNNDIVFDKYKELFYYKHLDNENAHEKSGYLPVTPKAGYSNKCLAVFEKNKRLLNYDTKLDTLYRNCFQSFMFSVPKNNGVYIPLSSSSSIKAGTNMHRFIYNVFKMEDITQSYYSIKLRSNSIPEICIKFDFIGTIQCIYKNKYSLDLKDYVTNFENSNHQGINVSNNYFELEKRSIPGDVNLDILVKFNDMQNVQSFRLFMLAALITLCLTQAIKSSFKVFIIYPHEIRSNRKRNMNIMNSSNNNEDDVNNIFENDTEPPVFTLD